MTEQEKRYKTRKEQYDVEASVESTGFKFQKWKFLFFDQYILLIFDFLY